MNLRAALDLIALLWQVGILDDERYRVAANLIEESEGDAVGRRCKVVDKRVGRRRTLVWAEDRPAPEPRRRWWRK